MLGYNIEFCDINLNDFCFDYEKLEIILFKHYRKDKNIIIWPTALIGFCPNFDRLIGLANKYNAELFCDCCENILSNYCDQSILSICKMSSISTFFAHQVTSIEGGFVFLKDEEDYILGKMIRNHGLTRSLGEDNFHRINIELDNPTIDKKFLFGVLGTNFRSTDLNAMFGLLDFKRVHQYKEFRKKIYKIYYDNLDKEKYYLPVYKEFDSQEFVAFCLTIFRKDNKMEEIKKRLNNIGIETRPIIGSNLVLQPPFKKYYKPMENAQWVHEHGFYIGLNNNLKEKDILNLCWELNNI